MDFNKKMNKNGAVSLPAALRRDYGIEPGTKFNISVYPCNGDIILKRIEKACFFCGSEQNITTYQGLHICKQCANNIQESQVSSQ